MQNQAVPQYRMETAEPAALKANPWNTNHVDPDNEAKLEEAIKRFGFFKPVICREIHDGSLQIVGGEHRWQIAKKLKLKMIPIMNLGEISEERAKEISVVDNGRYGNDDSIELAELLSSMGTVSDLAAFLPFSEAEMNSLFTNVNIDLDGLDMPDESDVPAPEPKSKPTQTHQVMRFKVPVEDAESIMTVIEEVMKTQKFTEEDALANAGNALVYLLTKEKT